MANPVALVEWKACAKNRGAVNNRRADRTFANVGARHASQRLIDGV
jgi:hypothetical protein